MPGRFSGELPLLMSCVQVPASRRCEQNTLLVLDSLQPSAAEAAAGHTADCGTDTKAKRKRVVLSWSADFYGLEYFWFVEFLCC